MLNMAKKLGKKRTRLDNKRKKEKDSDESKRKALARRRDQEGEDRAAPKGGRSLKGGAALSPRKKEKDRDEESNGKKKVNKDSFKDTVKEEQGKYHGDSSAKAAQKAVSDYVKAEDLRKNPEKKNAPMRSQVDKTNSIYRMMSFAKAKEEKPLKQERESDKKAQKSERKLDSKDQKSEVQKSSQSADKYLSAPAFPTAKTGGGSSGEGAEHTHTESRSQFSSREKDRGKDLGQSR